jgi:hypothetical protein
MSDLSPPNILMPTNIGGNYRYKTHGSVDFIVFLVARITALFFFSIVASL